MSWERRGSRERCALGGVSTMTRSKRLSRCSASSRSAAMYSCVAAERAGDVPVERVGRGSASLCIGLRRWPSTSPSNVVAESSIKAHSSPGPSTSSCTGSLVNPPGTPNASASRLAGSMVTTTQRRAVGVLPAVPSAAAVVVLPTPPDPQQTTTSAVAIRSSSSLTAAPRGRRQGLLIDFAVESPPPRSDRQADLRQIERLGEPLATPVDEVPRRALRNSAAARSGESSGAFSTRQIARPVEGIDDDRAEVQTALRPAALPRSR